MFSKWMRLAYKKDIQEISEWTDKISKTGRKNQKLFCSYAIKLIRECLMRNITKNRIQIETKEKQVAEKKVALEKAALAAEKTALAAEKAKCSLRRLTLNIKKITFFTARRNVS